MENKKYKNPGLDKPSPVNSIADSRHSTTASSSQQSSNTNFSSTDPLSRPNHSPEPTDASFANRQQAPANQPNKNKKKLTIAAVIVIFAAAATVGIILLLSSSNTKAPARPQVSQNDSRVSANADETKIAPPKVDNYKVAPNLPRKISIAKIGVDGRILALGVKRNNELKAPVNIYDTGWYESSAKPGEQGAMLIDGHVHGPTQPGIFYNLKKLVAGDIITIERGDGTKFNYRTVSAKTYDKDKVDMAAAMTPIEAGKPGLNLITCAGSFNTKANQYEDRLIVFATL